jgi:hypothetical protein
MYEEGVILDPFTLPPSPPPPPPKKSPSLPYILKGKHTGHTHAKYVFCNGAHSESANSANPESKDGVTKFLAFNVNVINVTGQVFFSCIKFSPMQKDFVNTYNTCLFR